MPRRQVYGKRGRAVYDPFAAFVSPPHSTAEDLAKTPESIAAERSGNNRIRNRDATAKSHDDRIALQEQDANVRRRKQPCAENGTKSKPGSRARRKVLTKTGHDLSDSNAPDNDIQRPESSAKQTVSSHQQGSSEDGTTRDHIPLPTHEDIQRLHARKDGVPQSHETQHVGRDDASYNIDTSQLARHSYSTTNHATLQALDDYSDHCAGLLQLSSHHSITGFSEWSEQLLDHFNISKIAEASFGEVYRLSLREQISGFSSSDESVLKIIALKPPGIVRSRDKKKYHNINRRMESLSTPENVANEVRLLLRMNSIPGFTNFREVRVVQGRPTQPFINAFRDFNAAQKKRKKELSHFPDPSKSTSYPDDQLWAVIEMQDAGTDLERLIESGGCSSIWFVWDVFWQVVLSLAKGEEGAEFEHRDLHLGNICVHLSAQLESKTIDAERKLYFTNTETTIIDYTISRALMQDDTVAYHDLVNESALFEGDSTEEYQYDIYRYMRGALLRGDPYAEAPFGSVPTDRTWEQYHPVTNLIWLHYILYQLLEQLTWPSSTKAPPKKQKAECKVWKRASDLEHILLRVQEVLDPGAICHSETKSAGGLVSLALSEGWLDGEDINGVDDEDEDVKGLANEVEALQICENSEQT